MDNIKDENQEAIVQNNDQQEPPHNDHKAHLDPFHELQLLFVAIGKFMQTTLSIREGTDIDGTIEGIKKDIVFRGHTAWILMFSIFIASIGLNVNSTPVIVGAMLISPLMGPILGIGLSVGTNDWETLLRSLKNFGVAIIISLITSTVYFMITPLTEAQSELLARTKPTFLDVLIAVFGGLAGIVAGSRKEKSNVIPGVAIATALMPPLCTAGYGLANLNFSFFFGAFYLFFLNSVFISISTFMIVKYLHFPVKNFIHSKRAKKIRAYIIVFVILVIIPSGVIFVDVIKESRFNISVSAYVKDNLHFDNAEIINKNITFNDTLSRIDVYVIGDEISPEIIATLNKRLEDYGLIRKGTFWKSGNFYVTKKTVLRVHQAKDNTAAIVQSKIDFARSNISEEVRKGLIADLFTKNEQLMAEKTRIIDSLSAQLSENSSITNIPFDQVSKEVRVQYPQVSKFAYARSIETDFDLGGDTIPTFLVKWSKRSSSASRRRDAAEMKNWLQVRLNLDTVRIVSL